MIEFDELLEKLNCDIIQDGDWEESLPEELYAIIKDIPYKTVAEGLDVDKHRWYEISTTVISILDRFIGIREITNIFSESMSISDCDFTLQFFEMEEVLVKSYTYKEKI